jgi:class 3 adenylate cyclase
VNVARPPQAHYAHTADGVRIGYWTHGSGPIDIVGCSSFAVNLDVDWDRPAVRAYIDRMASQARVIELHRRGTGLSDPVPLSELSVIESWVEDVRAVLDDVGSRRAAFIGYLEGGHAAMVFAATHPERVSHIVLVGSWARLGMGDDYPIGLPPDVLDAYVDTLEQSWGSDRADSANAFFYDPAEWSDPVFRAEVARRQRVMASPTTVAGIVRACNSVDVRHVLPLISHPTLVMQPRSVIPRAVVRYLADHITDAQYRERDVPMFAGVDANREFADTVLEFVTGRRPPAPTERVLATMLFTDVVGSTEHTARLGDRAWGDLLDRHDRAVRREVAAFRGQEVKTTGDGFLVRFDGPARAIRCAGAVNAAVRELGLHSRAGVHCGEVELRPGDVSGIAVNIAQRVSALAGPDEVLVSRTVVDLVAGSEIEFADAGEHTLKGVPGDWRLYRVSA